MVSLDMKRRGKCIARLSQEQAQRFPEDFPTKVGEQGIPFQTQTVNTERGFEVMIYTYPEYEDSLKKLLDEFLVG